MPRSPFWTGQLSSPEVEDIRSIRLLGGDQTGSTSGPTSARAPRRESGAPGGSRRARVYLSFVIGRLGNLLLRFGEGSRSPEIVPSTGIREGSTGAHGLGFRMARLRGTGPNRLPLVSARCSTGRIGRSQVGHRPLNASQVRAVLRNGSHWAHSPIRSSNHVSSTRASAIVFGRTQSFGRGR